MPHSYVYVFWKICSGFTSSPKSKNGGKKDSLSDVPSPAFDFSNMTNYRGNISANDAIPKGIADNEGDESRTTEDELMNASPTFKLCTRSQFRRNTDFSQASQDLKKFLADREKRRDSDQEILDILPPPSYK